MYTVAMAEREFTLNKSKTFGVDKFGKIVLDAWLSLVNQK